MAVVEMERGRERDRRLGRRGELCGILLALAMIEG